MADLEKLQKEIQKLKKENADLKKKKKFGLVWEEREREQDIDDGEYYPYLVKKGDDFGIENGDSNKNLLIEGDNYHALQILQYTHKNKIDVIYIDPPYNTGTKDEKTGKTDFKYNDDYIDKEDGYRHSKWLSFMNKRLILAKELLTKDGVLFISIDDNEYARLYLLLQNYFLESKLKTIVVKMSEVSGLKMASVAKLGTIPKLKEYIIIAKKDNLQNLYIDKIPKESWDDEYNIFLENFTKKDKKLIDTISQQDDITTDDIKKVDKIVENIDMTSVSKKLKDLKITAKDKEQWLFDNSYRIARTTASSSVHRLAIEKKEYNNNNLFFVKSARGLLYFVKSTFSEDSKKPRVQMIFAEDNLTQHLGDFWSDIKTTGLDGEGGVSFKNGKKPLKLLKRLIGSIKKDNLTVLDFFAGSGSTGHAVMDIEQNSDCNYTYILCTNNENNIAEGITHERLKKSNEKHNYNSNLEYLKLETLKYDDKRHSELDIKDFMVDKLIEILKVKEMCFSLEKISNFLYRFNKENKDVYILSNIYSMGKKDYEDAKKLLEQSSKGIINIYVLALQNHAHYENKLSNINKQIIFEPLPENFLKLLRKIQRKKR